MSSNASLGSGNSLRGFWGLIVTQFQGAFSDNVYRTLAMFLFIGMSLGQVRLPGDSRELRMALVGALFSLPFVLFSMAGGYLADRYSKRLVTIGVKVLEIIVMLLATVALAGRQWFLLLVCVFLMGAQSAFFGPSKYGLLPELLPEKRLSWGNGIIELGTFLAIILGTIGGGWLFEAFKGAPGWAGLVLVGLAVLGTCTSLGIDRVPAANPTKQLRWNPLADFFGQLRLIRQDRVLTMAVAGNAYFFFMAALIQQYTIYAYGKDLLGLSEGQITSYLMPSMAAGIGIGSVAAGYLSGKKIEYGLVPLGCLGMTFFGIYLALPHVSVSRAVAGLGAYGFFAGFFIVPIAALIQHRPDRGTKGAVIGASNLLSFIGIFASAGVFYLLGGVAGLNPCRIFLITAVLTLVATVYTLWLVPDALLRFVLWALTRTIYRIRVVGRDNIPEKGGALFVCNHVSFVDALLLLASTDRRVRFMMFKRTYELPYMKPFARILGIIPISSEQRPREMIQSLQAASDAIRRGDIVCIFAEGQITRIGHLLPFRRGFERIMKDAEAPIIPVALDGVWGSIFSFEKGRFLWKLPRRLPYPITVNYGRALPPTATPFEVRQAVQGLLAEAWAARRQRMLRLHRAFVRTARLHPFRFAMGDALSPRVTFAGALMRSIFLARRLGPTWQDQRMVGLLLPPSVAGAAASFAAWLSGHVPVHLNYTVPEETLASCIRQCGIRTVLTSRRFLEKVKLKMPCDVVMIEDVAGVVPRSEEAVLSASAPSGRQSPPGTWEKLIVFWMAYLTPVGVVEHMLKDRSPKARTARAFAATAQAAPEASPRGEPLRRRGREDARPTDEERATAAREDARPTEERSATAAREDARPTEGESAAVDRLDDLATVIFSSGSTGEPKGVMLSHYNVGSNVEQLEQVFGLNRRDCFLGILPFFHSFGFTGTLCLPAVLGLGVVYHPNPLDAKAIGPLVQRYRVTFLLSTPTFLQLYMRGCSAEEFGSLRLVMTGAEKLPDRLATAFEEQFGIRPLEGYGCTECAPAVAVNTYDYRSAGFRQIGAKRGKIGHPVPGVSVRVVDPDTLGPLPAGQPGLLLVRGPNVMQGYLGRPDKTAEVLREGWYMTGDIAAVDEDGFLQITDRLSRFSKIGGEMVPHIKVEEKLHELAGATEQLFVVAGVPDEKKGERLVVLHRVADGALQDCLAKFAQADLPNLWKPRADQFFRVDTFPYLGTGKLDLRKVREMAMQLARTE